MATEKSLPLINLRDFIEGCPEAKTKLAEKWDHTFQTSGFCLLTGYDAILPEALIQDLRREAHAYFELPAEHKKAAWVDGIIGYLAHGDENVAATLGTKTVGADLVESLNFSGYQEPGSEWHASKAEAECPWLSQPYVGKVPEPLRLILKRYWGAVTELMQALMSLTEMALDLPSGFFQEPFETPGTLLKLAYYPADGDLSTVESDTGAAQQRYGAHTDYDGFTILQRDPADGFTGGGLEIQLEENGDWVKAQAPPGTLTINIGDLLARWTNDRWRATLHRVTRAPSNGKPRLSIVYFTGPHPDTVVRCLPSEKCSQGNMLYEPITARENVEAKLKAAVNDAESPEHAHIEKKMRIA